MEQYKLLAADYEQIDAELIGPAAVERGKVAPRNEALAPAQGNPFLSRVRSIRDILRHHSKQFR